MRNRRSIVVDNQPVVGPEETPAPAPAPAPEIPWGPGMGLHPNHPLWARLLEFYEKNPAYDPNQGRPPATAAEARQRNQVRLAALQARIDEIERQMVNQHFPTLLQGRDLADVIRWEDISTDQSQAGSITYNTVEEALRLMGSLDLPLLRDPGRILLGPIR